MSTHLRIPFLRRSRLEEYHPYDVAGSAATQAHVAGTHREDARIVWVAPTEPKLLREMPGAVTTTLSEKYGADVLWRVKGGYAGIQRKELSDLLASVADGRLAKEVQQMESLVYRWLVVEGQPKFTTDGQMLKVYGKPWSRSQYDNLLRGVAARGVIVEHTDGLTGTLRKVEEIIDWTRKSHGSLTKRPGPVSVWGKADNRDYQIHLLQGLPGVGYELAERILDEIGMPFGWRVEKKELLGVPGIGPKKASQIYAALGSLRDG